jgi:UDP-glucose 4-epimerase
MAILVTGGAGYIGSVTVDYLFARGEKVVVLDNLVRGHRQTLDAEVPFLPG